MVGGVFIFAYPLFISKMLYSNRKAIIAEEIKANEYIMTPNINKNH